MSVGWPNRVKLNIFGRLLTEVFGDMAYLVGSSVGSKDWRDVDVVVMMGPEKFYSWAGPHGSHGIRWQTLCAAYSLLGKELTGLPIDFKIQLVAEANERHPKPREAIGIKISPDYVEQECPDGFKKELMKAEEWLMSDRGGQS